MGPVVMDTVKDVKSIQQTLWEVSATGPALVISRDSLLHWSLLQWLVICLLFAS